MEGNSVVLRRLLRGHGRFDCQCQDNSARAGEVVGGVRVASFRRYLMAHFYCL